MNAPKQKYLFGVLRGLQSVLAEVIKLQEHQCHHAWTSSIVKDLADQTTTNLNEKLKEASKLDVNQVISQLGTLVFIVGTFSFAYVFSTD